MGKFSGNDSLWSEVAKRTYSGAFSAECSSHDGQRATANLWIEDTCRMGVHDDVRGNGLDALHSVR